MSIPMQEDPIPSALSISYTTGKSKSLAKTAVTISKLSERQSALDELLDKKPATASSISVQILLKFIIDYGCTWVS